MIRSWNHGSVDGRSPPRRIAIWRQTERCESMSIAWKTVLQREFEFREARTLATIRESETDGPSRRLVTGREPHPTGSIVCVRPYSEQ